VTKKVDGMPVKNIRRPARRRAPLNGAGGRSDRILFNVKNDPSTIAETTEGQFFFPVTERGETTHFTVFTDDALLKSSIQVAKGVLRQCETDYNRLAGIFGGPRPSHFNVIVTSGNGGVHEHCTGTDLYCGSSGKNTEFTNRIVVMEEVEVFEALQNLGWNCQASNGEALSRVLGEQFHPPQGENLITAPIWLDGDQGRPDFVTQNHPGDVEPQSIGCAVLFMYYLRFQLGFQWSEIVQAGGATLADVYKKLTGKNDAFQSFSSLLEAHFPKGKPSGLKDDNPFPLP